MLSNFCFPKTNMLFAYHHLSNNRGITVFTPLPMGEGLLVVLAVCTPPPSGRSGGALIQPLQLLSNLVVDTLSEGFHCHSSLLATALLTH